jgi:hypothetical protein
MPCRRARNRHRAGNRPRYRPRHRRRLRPARRLVATQSPRFGLRAVLGPRRGPARRPSRPGLLGGRLGLSHGAWPIGAATPGRRGFGFRPRIVRAGAGTRFGPPVGAYPGSGGGLKPAVGPGPGRSGGFGGLRPAVGSHPRGAGVLRNGTFPRPVRSAGSGLRGATGACPARLRTIAGSRPASLRATVGAGPGRSGGLRIGVRRKLCRPIVLFRRTPVPGWLISLGGQGGGRPAAVGLARRTGYRNYPLRRQAVVARCGAISGLGLESRRCVARRHRLAHRRSRGRGGRSVPPPRHPLRQSSALSRTRACGGPGPSGRTLASGQGFAERVPGRFRGLQRFGCRRRRRGRPIRKGCRARRWYGDALLAEFFGIALVRIGRRTGRCAQRRRGLVRVMPIVEGDAVGCRAGLSRCAGRNRWLGVLRRGVGRPRWRDRRLAPLRH